MTKKYRKEKTNQKLKFFLVITIQKILKHYFKYGHCSGTPLAPPQDLPMSGIGPHVKRIFLLRFGFETPILGICTLN